MLAFYGLPPKWFPPTVCLARNDARLGRAMAHPRIARPYPTPALRSSQKRLYAYESVGAPSTTDLGTSRRETKKRNPNRLTATETT